MKTVGFTSDHGNSLTKTDAREKRRKDSIPKGPVLGLRGETAGDGFSLSVSFCICGDGVLGWVS